MVTERSGAWQTLGFTMVIPMDLVGFPVFFSQLPLAQSPLHFP